MAESKIRRAMLSHQSSYLRKLRICILYYDAEDENTRGFKHNGLISRGFLDELAASISTKVTKVEELLLNFEPWSPADPPYLRLPRGTLSSGDLRCLALVHCDVSDVDVGTLRLAGVTMLILHNVSGSSETLNGLISACCNVRDLYLTVWPASHDLGISLDLSLQEVRKLDLDRCPGLTNFAIDAPNLRHVELMEPPRGFKFSMVKPLDLNCAVLDPGYWEHAEELIDVRNRVCEFGRARVVVLIMGNCGQLPLVQLAPISLSLSVFLLP